ncbi:hypothetical protein [Salmonella enterica]
MTTITRERLLKIQQWSETYGAGSNVMLPAEEAEELARIALASLEAEPVAYNQVQRDMMKDIIVRKMGGNLAGEKLVMDDIHAVTMALIDAGFRTAQPLPVAPEGYALVPVEPTDEMIAAAMNCEDVLFNSDESFCVQFGNIYEAMLAAAPQH